MPSPASRTLRLAAALAAAALSAVVPLAAPAEDVFEQMERLTREMQQRMNQSMGFSLSLGGGGKEVKVSASLAVDRGELRVGEPFAFVVSLVAPKNATIGPVSLAPSTRVGLAFTGAPSNLPDAADADPSNVVKRISVPARFDVPFKGGLSFSVQGTASGRETRARGTFSMTYTRSFECRTQELALDVLPLASDGQPEDFGGVVSEGLRLVELCDVLKVETNDVVVITYRMTPKDGYVPADYLMPGAAFEWSRQTDRDGRVAEVEYRRFFVADGAAATPKASVSYYDPRTKSYKRAEAGGTPLVYFQRRED